MNAHRKQLGMTNLGILTLLLCVGTIIWVTFKVVPPYFNNRFIVNALETLAEYENVDGGLDELSDRKIRRHLSDYFTVNNMRDESIESIVIDRERNKFVVKMNYEIREPFFNNIDLILTFNNEFDSSRPRECCDPLSD